MKKITTLLLTIALLVSCKNKHNCNSIDLPKDVKPIETENTFELVVDSTEITEVDTKEFIDTIIYDTIYYVPINVITYDTTFDLSGVFERINEVFAYLNVEFEVVQTEYYDFPEAKILQRFGYAEYINISQQLDYNNVISMWIVPTGKICNFEDWGFSCNRTGGWSFVGNFITSNFVMTDFDANNPNVIIHEIGHFFGLDHTFEEHKYGKEDSLNCENTGDRICDTPYDPDIKGYANYYTCKLQGYETLIDNYMSYYDNCYMREKKFTPQQWAVMEKNIKKSKYVIKY